MVFRLPRACLLELTLGLSLARRNATAAIITEPPPLGGSGVAPLL
jgi:hypothetical protein